MISHSIKKYQDIDRYMMEINRYQVLTKDEEYKLALRCQEGSIDAAHQLVVSNLRFVVKIAHEYRFYGLKLLDLIQEGNIGLMQAVKKYDPERGYRLVSYAIWWIRSYIHEFILRSWSLVKLGMGHLRRKLFFKLRSERSKLEQTYQDLSESDIVEKLAEKFSVSSNEISEMSLRLAAQDFSLDTPVKENSKINHIDYLESENIDQESELILSENKILIGKTVDAIFNKLNDKEKFILKNRLLDDKPQTLQEIGLHFNISRERVRQLEKGLLKKIKTSFVQQVA